MCPSPTAPKPLAFERLADLSVGSTARVELCRVQSGARAGELLAVKRLHHDFADDPELLDLFRDEAWMASALHHKNVAEVRSWGRDKEGPYLAFEFVKGVSLARLMRTVFKTGEMFTERLVVYFGACLCDALTAAHELRSHEGAPLNLVHRDLTPGNVLCGFDGEVKITDFGLAWANQRTTKTVTGILRGEPTCMAPEQIRAEPLDGRTDIFALGVLLFELFSGRPPWAAATAVEMMRRILREAAPDLRPLCPKLDGALVEVVAKCLEKDVKARYQSARELGRRLEHWLHAHGYHDSQAALARFVRRNAMRQMRWLERAIAGELVDGVDAPFGAEAAKEVGSPDPGEGEGTDSSAATAETATPALRRDPAPSEDGDDRLAQTRALPTARAKALAAAARNGPGAQDAEGDPATERLRREAMPRPAAAPVEASVVGIIPPPPPIPMALPSGAATGQAPVAPAGAASPAAAHHTPSGAHGQAHPPQPPSPPPPHAQASAHAPPAQTTHAQATAHAQAGRAPSAAHPQAGHAQAGHTQAGHAPYAQATHGAQAQAAHAAQAHAAHAQQQAQVQAQAHAQAGGGIGRATQPQAAYVPAQAAQVAQVPHAPAVAPAPPRPPAPTIDDAPSVTTPRGDGLNVERWFIEQATALGAQLRSLKDEARARGDAARQAAVEAQAAGLTARHAAERAQKATDGAVKAAAALEQAEAAAKLALEALELATRGEHAEAHGRIERARAVARGEEWPR